jgi:type IV pilus assembly protein PilE
MTVVLIIAILAAIAVPIYAQYTRKAQRAAAEGQMLKIAADLERWRGKALSYQGFVPETSYATTTGTISPAPASTLYLPIGSTSSNYKYQLAILDGTNRKQSLGTGVGQQWVIIAQPNTTNATLNLASRLVLNSSGVKCRSDSATPDPAMLGFISSSIDDSSLCQNPASPW